jgi:hypothetical protein
MTVRASELKTQLLQLAGNYLKRSITLERNTAPWPSTACSQSRGASDVSARRDTGREHLEAADRHVAESERIIAEWSALIEIMRADGRDVSVACDLLETFKGNLEVRRSSRDLIRQRVAADASACSGRLAPFSAVIPDARLRAVRNP